MIYIYLIQIKLNKVNLIQFINYKYSKNVIGFKINNILALSFIFIFTLLLIFYMDVNYQIY